MNCKYFRLTKILNVKKNDSTLLHLISKVRILEALTFQDISRYKRMYN